MQTIFHISVEDAKAFLTVIYTKKVVQTLINSGLKMTRREYSFRFITPTIMTSEAQLGCSITDAVIPIVYI